MSAAQSSAWATEDGRGRARAPDQVERFVAFTFAAADLVAEVEPHGTITFAAGAFRSRLGEPPEHFVGKDLRSIVARADHPALELGLELLRTKGRLAPVLVQLNARGAPVLAMAGLVLAPAGCPVRFCLTFAVPPAPASPRELVSDRVLKNAVKDAVRSDAGCDVGFIEVNGTPVSAPALAEALRAIAPGAVASELAPGRFGVIGGHGAGQLATALHLLEESLRSSTGGTVVSTQLASQADGLTATQAARALGQALITFARGGVQGLDRAGFGAGLKQYVDVAANQMNAVRRAIEGKRFELVFQPIVSLAGRKLHHFEALLRLDSGRAETTPQEFVLLVETLGLSRELDIAVAELACAAALRAPAPIAFNASGQSIGDDEFRARLLRVLAASPACRAGRLVVEMTETAEVQDLKAAARTVEALREIGVPFCLDDFGAGGADVRVLRALPASIVKLDGSFAPGVASGGRERGFVAAIIEMARAAGAEVVAERIETEAEAAAMQSVGVDFGQGWLFGKPGPLPEQLKPAPRREGERESWQ